MEQSFITNRFAICSCRKFYNVPFYVRWDNQQLKSKIYQMLLLLKSSSKKFLKIAAQTFEAGYFFNMFWSFRSFWGSFSFKDFSYKKTCVNFWHFLSICIFEQVIRSISSWIKFSLEIKIKRFHLLKLNSFCFQWKIFLSRNLSCVLCLSKSKR